MLRPILFGVLAILLALAPALAADAPPFTTVAHRLASQPIPAQSRLVYWDQAAADAVGLENPAGRAGSGALEAWVKEKLGVEVKDVRGSTPVSGPSLVVEGDAHGAAGRAAYVQLENGKWVNLKGIGRTRNRFAPPSAEFANHGDGALTLEEAIKEAVYARVTDNELTHGSSRVIGILSTGRTMRYPDGKVVPLATVIRAPMTRVFNTERPAAVAEGIAELNANRMLKGDFVNESNMGFAGQMVDFGCMTHTCGYAPANSPEQKKFLFELGEYVGKSDASDADFLPYLGYHLTNQMGLPETQILRPEANEALLEAYTDFAKNFRQVVLYSGSYPTPIDFTPIPADTLRHQSGLDQMMPRIAYEFFRRPGVSRREYVSLLTELHEAELARPPGGRTLSAANKAGIKQLYESAYHLLREVKRYLPGKDYVAYAEKIKRVAEFKNRDLRDLARPNVMRASGETAAAFEASRDPAVVQIFIDHLVHTNRLGTSLLGDANVTLDGDERETRVLLRADRGEDGALRLFSHPEAEARPGESFHFRLSTDDWKSYRDYPAELVKDPAGRPYFQLRIPHGDGLPVTETPLRLTPFLKAEDEARWPLPPHTSLEGPPLFLNERLGLPSDQLVRFDSMAEEFATPVRPWTPERKPVDKTGPADDCPGLFQRWVQAGLSKIKP